MTNEIPKLDFGPYTQDFLSLFQDTVTDLTNPEFVRMMSLLAQDALTIGAIRLQPEVEGELIMRLDAAVRARALAIVQIPGLVTASKYGQFLNIAQNVINHLITIGGIALNAYIGGAIPGVIASLTNAVGGTPKSA